VGGRLDAALGALSDDISVEFRIMAELTVECFLVDSDPSRAFPRRQADDELLFLSVIGVGPYVLRAPVKPARRSE